MLSKLILMLLSNIVWSSCISAKSNLKIVIDNDAGGDDAMAIFLALLYEKYFDGPQVVALTTTNGNTAENNVCVNNQRILKVAQRQDVPIYRGATKSLIVTPGITNYYGKDGLGDSGETLTDLHPVQNTTACEALIKLSKQYEGDLVVITLGPLTNVALAISFDPGFLSRLKHLYIAAGHINSIKYPSPEFNARMDVEAYGIIADAATPDKVTIFPYSQAIDTLSFEKAWRKEVLGSIPTDIMRAQNSFEKVSMTRYDTWHGLDPATVAVAINSDLIGEEKYCKNNILLCGEMRGINTNEFVDQNIANMRMIFAVKSEEYQKFLMDVFSAETKNSSL